MVKLDNLGFSKRFPMRALDRPLTREAADAERQDRRALAFALLELVLGAMGREGASPKTGAGNIERLLMDVYRGSLGDFRCVSSSPIKARVHLHATPLLPALSGRDSCLEDPDWEEAALLLDQDDRSGWKLMEQLLFSDPVKSPLGEILENSSFCKV